MNRAFLFFFNNILLGAGLAMDAFSVSLANGLNEPKMKRRKMVGVAGVFGIFQAAMPLIGWICVHTVVRYFESFEKLVPWIALVLLLYIGGRTVFDGLTSKGESEKEPQGVGLAALMVQGVATSIDALSAGFALADYSLKEAVVSVLIIGAVTFAVCLAGLAVGKRFGTRLADKAQIFGGSILIVIGLEIFITGII